MVAAAVIVGLVATSWALVRVNQEAEETKIAKSQLENANAQLAITNKNLADANAKLGDKNKHLRDKFLHEAISSAMSPNRERTLRSLKIAKEAGATASSCETVQGILARSEGKLDLALNLLKRAVELDPTNLAAKCEMFGVLFDKGEYVEFDGLKMEILYMEPLTAEDFVFKGKAYLIMWMHDEALSLIEQGQEMHPNPIFQVMHADALGDIGFHTKNVDLINTAYQELVDAQSLLGSDHAGIRSAMLDVIRQYVAVARLQDEKYEHLIPIGDECATFLTDSKVPTMQLARALYYSGVRANDADAKDAWIAAVNNGSGDLWGTLYAAFLLRTEGIEKAFDQFETLTDRSDGSLAWESVLLALDSDQRRARAAEIWSKAGDMFQGLRQTMIFTGVLLGDKDGLRATTRDWTEPPYLLPWIDFAIGKIGESELLQSCDTSFKSDTAHVLIAMQSLHEGNREKAMRHLQEVAGKGSFTRDFWAGGILEEMKRRPGLACEVSSLTNAYGMSFIVATQQRRPALPEHRQLTTRCKA